MAEPGLTKRIWGWWFFDWAAQPYSTLLLTFIFGPYIASVAAQHFAAAGADGQLAAAEAQSLWSLCLTVTGLIIAFGAPVMGALADTAGHRMPWIVGFSVLYVIGATGLWWTQPDGSNLAWGLTLFGIGFIGAEYAQIFINAQLPGLGTRAEIGRISGSGFAFGYVGGLVSLAIVLVFFVEQASGRTLVGLAPVFGLDPALRQGTRFVGPFSALWYLVFMVPYFLWVREVRGVRRRPSMSAALAHLTGSLRALAARPSFAAYLGSSMLYRDALNGLYSFGGTYALLILDWPVTKIGIFGIVSGISAAAISWVGGRFDRRYGPKPVIVAGLLGLMAVCLIIVNMSRTSLFGMTLAPDSGLPNAIFFLCGMAIGGLGGMVQSASRSMMVRHTTAETATEAFGLFGLSGRATAFVAPAVIGAVTALTGNARYGVAPLIGLFLLGLILLRWVKPDGDRAEP